VHRVRNHFRTIEIGSCLAILCLASWVVRGTGVPARIVSPGPACALPQTWAMSDFDGDNRPENVTRSFDGRQYHFDIRFSAGRGSESITFVSSELALSIKAVDIDHNNYVDLVVSSPIFPQLSAVWLNDGRGHFEKTERFYSGALLPGNLTSTYQSKANPILSVPIAQSKRLPLDRARCQTLTDLPIFTAASAGRDFASSRLTIFHLPARSPPPTSL
jgi:hypothetical protein